MSFLEQNLAIMEPRDPELAALMRSDLDCSHIEMFPSQQPDVPTARVALPSGEQVLALPYVSYVTAPNDPAPTVVYIRLEHLDTDMAPLVAHLGFTPVLPLANQSLRARDWRPSYSEADAATLGRICAQDIVQFGYRFDPQP